MPFNNSAPPIQTPFVDQTTGQIAEVWRIFLRQMSAALGTLAPVDAEYWVSRSAATLTAEQNLGSLSSGFLKVTTTFGIATPSTVAAIPSADVTGLVAAIAQLALITSGTYTPTLTAIVNVAASTARSCQYLRVGSVVHVSGTLDVDPTATATDTQLGISLPIASDFANATECAGTAWAPTLTSEGAAIIGDATNNRATMQWKAVDISNATRAFAFTYRVI